MTLLSERKRHARHEAGHALVSIVYGFPFQQIDIDDGTGDMQVAGAGLGMTDHQWHIALMCGFAGEKVNQKNARLTLVDILMNGHGDFEKLVDSFTALGGNPKSKSFDRYSNRIFEEAHNIVVEHRALHALLTKALLERSRLTWDECRQLYRDAQVQ